jgi:hypothetical protein
LSASTPRGDIDVNSALIEENVAVDDGSIDAEQLTTNPQSQTQIRRLDVQRILVRDSEFDLVNAKRGSGNGSP